jgi:uncharacterized protein (TIGR00725 family)
MTPPGAADYAAAVRLGELLALSGADVACGGYGGIMEAVARGAVENGGRAIGYTVRGWSMRTPNAYLTREHACADLYERLRHLIESADALVTLGGGIGTLVELALAWNHLYMKLIPLRPLLIVGPAWRQALDQMTALLEISDAHLALVDHCDDVEAAVDRLREKGVLT